MCMFIFGETKNLIVVLSRKKRNKHDKTRLGAKKGNSFRLNFHIKDQILLDVCLL